MLLNKLLTLATEGEPINELDKMLKDHQIILDNSTNLVKQTNDNISMFGKLKESITQLNDTLTNIGEVINKIIHPGLMLKDIWTFTVNNCYWVCLILCVGGLVYWICCGSKKGAIISKASLVTYILIKAISVV